MTCSECCNIQPEGSISQLWNTVGRLNLVNNVHQTLTQIVNNLRSSDFTTCRKICYNQSRGVYIPALEHCRKMKLRTYLHLKLISNFFLFVTVELFCGGL